MPGRYQDRDVTIQEAFEAAGAYSAGKISAEELHAIECAVCPGAGACGGQFTANTMACVAEALGMALPGSGSAPAISPERTEIHTQVAEAIVRALKDGLLPSQILTKEAFENAIAIGAATGGSTNIALHIPAIAHELGISDQKIKDAIAAFRGVRRRFEQVVNEDGRIYVDDYAHHPEELRALIKGARGLFAGKKCMVVFQPHLFSRTRDLAEGFARSLDLADEVILLPVYPAREKPMEGVNAGMIAERMKNPRHRIMDKEDLLRVIATERPELLITAGAGDIDQLTGPIKAIMEEKSKQ
jgi:hypothetical protein